VVGIRVFPLVAGGVPTVSGPGAWWLEEGGWARCFGGVGG
jgi:hypothetical protein